MFNLFSVLKNKFPFLSKSQTSVLFMQIIAIAAMAENRGIGKDGKIPWYIPEDFKHFKETTF